jgi:hypothetical protein
VFANEDVQTISMCAYENIPASSVRGKTRSLSILQKNLVTIIQNISES